MNKPHKYKDVIIHWANGGKIQYRTTTIINSTWHDWNAEEDNGVPFFADYNYTWRIKPETLRYRVALMKTKGDYGTYWTSTQDEFGDNYEDYEDFINGLQIG